MAIRDTDVEIRGSSLAGLRIVLGISGGIAAVDTVRLARELRRHGAELTVIMTQSAQNIITPLAVRWASQCEVITDWDGDLSALDEFDGILVAPATRNLMAGFVHGLNNGPLLMALSAARGRGTATMLIPSMHSDLAADPITDDLVAEVRKHGADVVWGPNVEGKQKTPSHDEIVAKFAHFVNRIKPKRKSIVVTLGATRSAIDDIRFVQNTSSGATGLAIADHFYRLGHDITCVVGVVSCPIPSWLPLIISTPDADDMLAELLAIAKDNIDAWIHCAAVLDYIVANPAKGKVASQQGSLQVELIEGAKHIQLLKELCSGSVRIGFKLESGIKQNDLIYRAVAQIEHSGMTAVIANRLEDLGNPQKPRGYLVDTHGAHFIIEDQKKMCDAIQAFVERGY
jgi:phosphopantothenoylcysteine decarboxylase / phosphopantothenate---cysteine ligase